MTWLLSVLIVLACIGGIIFIPYWVSVLIFGRERDEELKQWLVGVVFILASVVVLFIAYLSNIVHNYLF